MLGPRNRELLGLIPSALLVTAGFTAIFIQTQNKVSGTSLTYGGAFLALCLATHIVIRRVTPHADPYLFPLAAVLASIGIVELYAISINGAPAYAGVARQQGEWLAVGLVLLHGDDRRAARWPLHAARELPLPDRDRRRRRPVPPALAGDRTAGQRRLPQCPHWLALVRAIGVREDRDRRLSRLLPARQPSAARDGRQADPRRHAAADEAVRARCCSSGARRWRCCSSRARSAPH